MLGFSLSSRTHRGCAVVTIGGALDWSSSAQVLVRLQRVLAARPSFLVLDVTGVTRVDQEGTDVLAATRAQATRWPGVPCVLVDADLGVVTRLLSGDGVGAPPRMPSVLAALQGATTAGSPRTARVLLTADHASPRRARGFVADWCAEWDVEALTWSATLAASELVTNAVLHAAGVMELVLTLGAGELRLSVRDGQGDPPVLLHAGPLDDHGRGMALLDTVVDDWGVLPADDGAKVVWCVLSSPAATVPEPELAV
jgi:anti-sigma regulatory factor (Ser/Thr protein kinase)